MTLAEYSSLKALKSSFVGANIDAQLFEYLRDPASRTRIRTTLIDTYLPSASTDEMLIAADLAPLALLLLSVS